ncbi:hypothetical protein BU15DRAFT_66419 [Melanogaster broomeanus]|nr:hypothetical protein BU15DRAFT_66419 [Melanogaster broomeanus]
MNNSPPLSDSPQQANATVMAQPENSTHALHTAPQVEAHAVTYISPCPSDNSDSTSSDKLSALPGDAPSPSGPNHADRAELNAIHDSASAPSLKSLLGTRPFPSSSEHHDARAVMSEGPLSKNSPQRVSFEGSHSAPNHSPRLNSHVHPVLREAVTPSVRSIRSTYDSPVPTTLPGLLRSCGRAGASVPGKQVTIPPLTPGQHPRFAYLSFTVAEKTLSFPLTLSSDGIRIARVYEDAELGKPDLEHMIESYSNSRQHQQRLRTSSPVSPGTHYHHGSALPVPEEWTTTNVQKFMGSFIDSLMRECKTFNLVSALLLSAILSMFQNDEIAGDPLVRTAALLSLMSALMSLSYGCVYIVRSGTMRSMDKATMWAEEAGRTATFILWNVWIFLAMPAVWLAWLGVTALFVLGLVYFGVKTLLHTYGRVHEVRRDGGGGARGVDIEVRQRGGERILKADWFDPFVTSCCTSGTFLLRRSMIYMIYYYRETN